MSQAHIPQPDSGSAPGQTYTSVDEAPHGDTISAIGNAGPSKGEVTRHTLAHNNIDSYFYNQFIFQAQLAWTTSDPHGKLLWYMPIHPKGYNRAIARLATIYNTWGGGVVVNVAMAGTGFHAGKIVLVRVPPNLHPKDLGPGYAFTALEHEMMDVKSLGVLTLQAGDQRQVNYHYMAGETNDPRSWDIGGYIAMYVYQALNTSATGTPVVEILCSTKLASDFTFSQVIMPTPERDAQVDFVPPGVEECILDRSWAIDCNGAPLRELHINPTGTQPVLKIDSFMMYNIGGDSISDNAVPSGMYTEVHQPLLYAVVSSLDPPTISVEKTSSTDLCNMTMINSDSLSVYNAMAKNVTPLLLCAVLSSDGFKFVLNRNFPDGWSVSDIIQVVPKGNHYSNNSPTIFVPPQKESVISFSYSSVDPGSYQHRLMAYFFREGNVQGWFAPDQCALFTFIDAVEDLPLFSVKLYHEGFMTTRASANLVSFIGSRLKCVFSSLIGRNTAFPLNAQMNANRLNLASVHKKILRQEKRLPTTKE